MVLKWMVFPWKWSTVIVKTDKDFSVMKPKGLEVFNHFSAIKELGVTVLQSLCDDWKLTPMAQECGVKSMHVFQHGDEVLLDFRIELTHQIQDGDETHFPVDDLLMYLADNGIAELRKTQGRSRVIAGKPRDGRGLLRFS